MVLQQAISESEAIEALLNREIPKDDDSSEHKEDEEQNQEALDEENSDEQSEEESTAPEEEDQDVEDEQVTDDTDDVGPAIDPPGSWSAEAKEKFHDLPRDLQENLAENERRRTQEIRTTQDEIAKQRKELEAREAEISTLRDQYAEKLKQAVEISEPVPPSPDLLDENSEKYDPDAYHKLDARYRANIMQFNEKKKELQEIRVKQEQDWVKQLSDWQQEQAVYYSKHIPELMDKDQGPALSKQVMDYGQQYGLDAERLKWASASEVHILYKAYQYDRLSDKSKETKQRLSKVPKTIKPGGGEKPRKLSPLQQKIQKKMPLTIEEAQQALLERSTA